MDMAGVEIEGKKMQGGKAPPLCPWQRGGSSARVTAQLQTPTGPAAGGQRPPKRTTSETCNLERSTRRK